MNKRFKIILLLVLIISGCQKSEIIEDDQQIIYSGQTNEYPIVGEFNPGSTRNYHGTYLGSYDIIEIGKELIERSKNHFEVKDHFLQEGQIIDSDRLGALVRRESPTNPYGLNPQSGSQFDIGNGILLDDPVLVADVVEVNFYKSANNQLNLAGMSVAIVFNQIQKIETSISVTTYEIDDERMLQYAMDVGRKLESYLRTLNQVGDIPIYIGLFTTRSVDSSLPGNYMADGYFVARSGQFSKLNQKWLIFPSNEATMLDGNTSSFFNGFKQTVQTLIPESTGVMGKGYFENDQLKFLKIDVQMVAKSFMEVKATTQMIAQMIQRFENNRVHVLVEIKTLSNTIALIERIPLQDKVNVTYISV